MTNLPNDLYTTKARERALKRALAIKAARERRQRERQQEASNNDRTG